MESKQNVFFLNWTHFDIWVILTCFHDDLFHFFRAVLWVCSNVQGFIANSHLFPHAVFFTKRGVQSLHKKNSSTFPAMEPTYHCYSSAWGAQCDLLGLSFGSSSSRLPIGKRRTVPTPVGGPSWGFRGLERWVCLEKWQVSQVSTEQYGLSWLFGILRCEKNNFLNIAIFLKLCQVCTLGLAPGGLWERFRQRCGT